MIAAGELYWGGLYRELTQGLHFPIGDSRRTPLGDGSTVRASSEGRYVSVFQIRALGACFLYGKQRPSSAKSAREY